MDKLIFVFLLGVPGCLCLYGGFVYLGNNDIVGFVVGLGFGLWFLSSAWKFLKMAK